jgi:nucleoside-diphosphate-sugar epimerase
MSIMILGAGGAVGAAITRYAAANGFDTDGVLRATTSRWTSPTKATLHSCDVRDARALRQLVERQRPDLIVNAAFPSGQPTDDAGRERLLSGMMAGVLGVIHALRDARYTGRLVLLGSAMCYGDGDGPRRASDPLRPQSFRGAIKASESVLMTQLAREHELRFTELRIFTGYGPFEQRERFVAQLVRAGLTRGRVRLTARPFERDWIHYDDIARACLSLLDSDPRSGVVNLCSGELTSTHAVAAMMERIVGDELVDPTPYERGDRYGDARPGLLPDPREGFSWLPAMSLQQGLEETWAWARSRAGSAYLLENPATS